MNRRNFMKTFALAKEPDRRVRFKDPPTVDPTDPEFLRQFRRAMKNTKFKKPFKGYMRMTADVLHGLEGLEREE